MPGLGRIGIDPAGMHDVQIAHRFPALRPGAARTGGAWLLVLLVLLGIVVGLAVWLSRESTLRSVAAWVSERTAQRWVFDDPHGSLLSRATFTRIVWHANDRTVTFDDVGLRWSPWWLLVGVVAVDNATASRMTVALPPGTGSATPPTSLKPAMRVRIERAHTAELDIVRGSAPTVFRDVGFQAGAGWRDWYFKLSPAQTPWGVLTMNGRIAHSPPFDLRADVAFKRDAAQPVDLELSARGPLERFDIDGKLAAKQSTLTVHAVATPYAPLPFDAIDAKLASLDPHDFISAAPAAALEGGLSATRDGDVLRGSLRITNAAAGTLDADRMPLTAVEAALTGRPDGFDIANLVADFGPAGRIEGQARITGTQVAVDLHSQRVDLHGVRASMKPTALKGSVGVTGDLSTQDVRVDLAQKNYVVRASAQVTPDAIVVQDLRAAAAGGSLRASGRLGFDAERSYAVKASLARFDPSQFGLPQKASLSGTVGAQGGLTPKLHVKADIALARSTWSGLPAAGQVRWRSFGVEDPRIAIVGHARIGATNVDVKGRLEDPANLRSLDLTLALAGQDMAELYAIFRTPLPSTAPYRIDGRLRYNDAVWSFENFHGTVGRSDLAGTFAFDHRGSRPLIKANLVSERLDITDLSGFVGDGPHKAPTPGKVLPHSEYDLAQLRSSDADVTFAGRRFRNETLPLNRMNTHLVLRNGLLTLDPLEFGAAGGRLNGRVVLDARPATIAAEADLRAQDLNLARLAPGVKALVQSTGRVDARVRLKGQGNSVAALLGNADGTVAAVMSGGQISDLALRLANLDLANALVAVAKGNQPIPIRCLVADFKAENGVLTPDPLVLDTEHTLVRGEGRVSLGDETLGLRLAAQPKDGSILALRGPIQVEGTMAHPSVRPELGNMLARAGAAVALGIFATPAAALLPFVEIGKRVEVDCAQQLEKTRAFVTTG
jgi:uncharacterized protein involved in outer membrane biogenesis